MINTVADVYARAQAKLNDLAAQTYTTVVLQPFLAEAYSILYRALDSATAANIRREVYYLLPAYTNVLTVAQLGVTDLSNPFLVQERGSTSDIPITGATAANPIVLTATGHGLSTSTQGVVSSVGGLTAANGMWFVTVPDANHLALNGSTGVGAPAYTSGGTFSVTGEGFTTVTATERLSNVATNALGEYCWRGGQFLFDGATSERQLKISYYASDAVPSSGSLGIDDVLDFLGTMTASLAIGSRNGIAKSSELAIQALGPGLKTDGSSGGYLGDFCAQRVRDLNKKTYQFGRFRPRRNRTFDSFL